MTEEVLILTEKDYRAKSAPIDFAAIRKIAKKIREEEEIEKRIEIATECSHQPCKTP